MATAVESRIQNKAVVFDNGATGNALINPAISFIQPVTPAPFKAIEKLFDRLSENPNDADALNATYPTRGVFKAVALANPLSDQKLTIDLSNSRVSRIPDELQDKLDPYGFNEVMDFFATTSESVHKEMNLNFRLCDYTPATADPDSSNGCGAHTDYGTFSIIFQDGTGGLEIESPTAPGTWVPVPGDATVVLCGWCALILTGGNICAVRHRVRRVPGVRRLSAVLFMAPDLGCTLKPMGISKKAFSAEIMEGQVNVKWFKEYMGKRWRWREGNEALDEQDIDMTQDEAVGKLVWG